LQWGGARRPEKGPYGGGAVLVDNTTRDSWLGGGTKKGGRLEKDNAPAGKGPEGAGLTKDVPKFMEDTGVGTSNYRICRGRNSDKKNVHGVRGR